ncbi:MAG: peptidoglycan-binding protein [Candidatus Nanopelagicales bacterium]
MHRRGDTGAAVAEVRARLAHLGYIESTQSEEFDDELDRAVRTFQQERGLTVDGIVGPDTFRRLDEARWQLGDRVLRYVPGHLMRGDDVSDLQRRLSQLGFNSGRADGAFGPRTDAAVREFQRSVGDSSDGTCGPETFRAFERLVRTVSGGNAANLRDRLAISALQTGIADKVVVIDPGFDTDDPKSNEIAQAIASRVEGRLAALGTQVFLTRSANHALADDPTRADFANRTDADLMVSIHCDRVASPHPNGIATFYFGEPTGSGAYSYSGKALAEQIQVELCARTRMHNNRSHARTWDLLRMTRMPTVRVDIGYLSNPGDAARLVQPAHQDLVAAGLAAAIGRFCMPV